MGGGFPKRWGGGVRIGLGLGRDTCVGHPQTCVYPDVCLGDGDVSGKAPLPGQGAW